MDPTLAPTVQPHAPLWVRALPGAMAIVVVAGLIVLPFSPLKPAEQARYIRAAELDVDLAERIGSAMANGTISGYEAMPLWYSVGRVLDTHTTPVDQDACSLPAHLAYAGSAEANTAKEGSL